MPIYEYQCDSCGHTFESLQDINDDPLVDCPACQQPHLKKLMSAAAFRLKGAGWYETDFKRDGKKNLAEADSSRDGKSGESKSSDSKPSDSKPSDRKPGDGGTTGTSEKPSSMSSSAGASGASGGKTASD